MNEKREVIKHSAAIHIQNNITLLQRRAWNVLLALAYDQLPEEEEHQARITTVMKMLEFDSKNEDYLKEALEVLISCKLKWNLLGKDRELEWGVTTLLAQAKIKNGVCTYAYSPELRRRLYNPRMYARISLSMQNKFKSKHAQALWELCVDCLDESKNYGETRFIPLSAYRELMGITEDMYPEFKKLNVWVLKSSMEEINRVTDFEVKAEYKRECRKVTAVKFKVRRVISLHGLGEAQKTLFPDLMDMPNAVRELKIAGMAPDEAWKIWQEGFNYVDEEKRPRNLSGNPETAFDRYVMEKVHLLKRLQKEGKVKNITGFLRTALKQNYSNPEFTEEKKKNEAREKANDRLMADRKRQKLEEQEVELRRSRDKKIHELCEQVVKESPGALREALEIAAKEMVILRTYLAADERTLLETHRTSMTFYLFIDKQLQKRFPERFTGDLAAYEAELAALQQEIAALEKVAA